MRLVLRTAPGEIFDELDISGFIKPQMLDPESLDIEQDLWSGDISLIKRAMRMQVGLRLEGITSAQIDQIRKWKHERTFLRVNGNYCGNTVFYQSFQRKNQSDDSLGAQIGTAPLYDCDVTHSGQRTYLHDDGKLYPVADDIPRYEDSCYGMKGLLIESQIYNYMAKSHPQNGDLLWAVDTGSPTLAWSTAFESNVYGMTGTCNADMATGEKIKHTANASYAAHPNSSYYVWVKGWGTVHLEIYEVGTGVVKTTAGTVLSPHEWTRLEALDFPIGNIKTIEARIVADTAAHIFIAGDQLTQHPRPSNYIHNITSYLESDKEMDLIVLSNLSNISGAATIMLGFKMLRIATPLYASPIHYFLTDTSLTFKLQYQLSTLKFYFQKKSASQYAEYQSTKITGNDVHLTALYDKDVIELWEDGIEKDSNSYTGIVHTVSSVLYLGDSINKLGPQVPIAFLRIDDQRLSDADILKEAQLYTDEDARFWTNSCEGRDFMIKKITNPLRVGPGTWDANVTLKEASAEETATLRTR